MTYGDVAASVGSRAPRAVGTVMARYGTDLPWWRVVRASGRPAAGLETRALDHYLAEATPLTSASSDVVVALARARFMPS